MERIAVFVDAGYLFAQGSTALTGSKVSRIDLSLSSRSVVEELRVVAEAKAPRSSLLRIYWYDGALAGTQMTSDQAAIADLDDVKLRLGFINSFGQQKGVDSLIVTDLIELARQKAISDAVLLSGDEDVRIGVQIAQNYGVRVHLLGIVPARGSQSRQLRQEADTTFEWDRQTIAKFLSKRTPAPEIMAIAVPPASESPVTGNGDRLDEAAIEITVAAFVEGLEESDLVSISAFWKTERGVPPEFDKKILAQIGQTLKRRASREEMRLMRTCFRTCVLKRLEPKGDC